MKKNYLFLFVLLAFFSSSIAQQTAEGFMYDNEARTYLIYIPTTYDATTDNLPLVLALHGLADTKEDFNNFNGFKALAESEKFILVTPQAEDPDSTEMVIVPFLGSVKANTVVQRGWHSGAGGINFEFLGAPISLPTAYYVSQNRDDVGFLSTLIDSISNKFGVDSNRVYSTGFSMGGFMSNRLACELSNKIAAIASVSGTIGNEIKNSCNPDEIIPALHIHSTNDETVGYTNNNWGMDAKDNVAFWVSNNNCNPNGDTTDLTNVANDGFVSKKIIYNQGDSASEVEFYYLEGPDHIESWYTGNADFNAAQKIWEFFARHEKTRTIKAEEPQPNSIANEGLNSFEIYPNPTNGRTTLDFSENVSYESITISNTIGKIILKTELSVNRSNFSIDLSNQPNGVYFIKLEEKFGNQAVKRLIKN